MKKSKGKIILVDDEEIVRLAYENHLDRSGFEVASFDSAEKALAQVTADWPGIVISDIIMPGISGLEFQKKIRERDPDLPVILITGQGDIPMAVEAMQNGAYDFLEKPFETSRLIEVVNRALEKRRLVTEIRRLRTELGGQDTPVPQLIGKSAAMEKLLQIIRNIAETDVDVLLLGETGTGKDLVARCIHDLSPRRKNNFVAINCGAIPESIIEAELFGHEPGAFTGAGKLRIGKFEYADGGTLFLDEIESMPMHLQVKLLRVLQEREIERLGSNTSIKVDLRVIAATKADLKKAYDENRFRKDLFYRLNVVQLNLPSLRERAEDIPLLFQHFTLKAATRYNVQPPALTEEKLADLMSRRWEGNIRELKNEAEKYVLGLDLAHQITATDGNGSVPQPEGFRIPFKEQIAAFEKRLIEQELMRQHGNMKKIQEALGIPKQTLYDKIKTYGLNQKDYK